MTSFSHAEDLIRFDIDQQRADRAIISFAQQANQTIIFSFELTKLHQANKLKGFYPIKNGLDRLLAGTNLHAFTNPSGQLKIALKKERASSANTNNSLPNNVIKDTSKQYSTTLPRAKIEKISIVGSRVAGRTIDDLPVPVDILSAEMIENTGKKEVGSILQAIAPSFNLSRSAISDGTDVLRPATLRGLGPDQTLVLINGKRRHQASLIHINTSVGRGTAGTDMNAIPYSSIKRIEVLRDGAAAQYGSDAIAGVINIVLNDNDNGGEFNVSYGEFKEGDGEAVDIALTKGFSLGDNGFLNMSLHASDKGYTNRAGLHGSCQFSGCIELDNGNFLIGDPRETVAPRNTFRIGDADSEQMGLTLNSGYELGYGELYGFIMLSKRDNESAAFFRHNANHQGNAPLQDGDATIPAGFLPKIESEIEDSAYSIGYVTDFFDGAMFDISYTYGKNTIDYTTKDTINSSYANYLRYGDSNLDAEQIRSVIPRSAFAYGLFLTLQTFNVDYSQDFELFSLAVGAEFRVDEYGITPGEEYSYHDYDTDKGERLFPDDRTAGTQGFGGISAESNVDEQRDVISLYVDLESRVNESLLINTALRYDKYDGFGDSSNFKLAANWTITEQVNLRGAISSGFRAPSMQQLYFNNISTQFISDPDNINGDQIALQVGTFRNDSPLAQQIGIPELKEEESINYSVGAVYSPARHFSLSVDFYAINIDDRIVISNKLEEGLSPTLDAALKAANVTAGQFFLNGADTETTGVDIIATWSSQILSGQLDLTFAANFTKTEVTKIFSPLDSDLSDISPDDIFAKQDISIIEEWQPEDRISLNSLYHNDDWSVNLAFNRYGEYTILDGSRQTYSAELLTDIRVKYQFNKHLSFNVGSNNIFDVTPDKNHIGNSRAGTIVDNNGNEIVSSTGVFNYSRRSAPFGFNGAFYYAGAEYRF